MSVTGNDQPTNVRNALERAQQDRKDRAQKANDRDHNDRGRDDRDNRDDRDSRDNRDRDDRDNSRRSESRRGDHIRGSIASLANIGRMNPTPIAMSGTAEVLESFRRDFVEAMPAKDDNNMLSANVFPIDAANAGIPFSLLVVAGVRKGKESLGVGHHTFMLAASAEPLRPREESFRGNRVFIVQVPSDGYDKRTRDVIKEVLGRHYPGQKLLSADAEVIQPGFPLAKDDPSAIADCVKNAFAAIKTAIDRRDPDAPALSLRPDDNSDIYNTIHVQHRQNHMYDRGHQPIRVDAIIDLQSREGRSRNSRDSIDQLVTGTRISRVGGYFDFVYAPPEGANSRNELFVSRRGDRRAQDDEFQMYALRWITTLIDTVDFSPTTMLLAMATVNAIGDSKEVMRAFEPNMSLSEDDPRNIGALVIEPNLEEDPRGFGKRYDTKTQTFTTGKRQSLLRTVVRPGIIYSIDVNEANASTWQYLDLLAAAQGDQAALDRIYDAAVVLTDGHIEDEFERTDLIIDPHVERIHAGYYTEGSGSNIRYLDLRDFDYLALLNMLKPEKQEDLDVINRWGMAAATNDETLLSQSDRYEIIRDFVPTAVITGYYQRFNFTTRWNEALVNAIARCKLSLNPTTSGRDGNERFRTTYGNIDQILQRPGSGGLYRNQRMGRDRNYDERFDSRSEERYKDRW